MALIHTNFFSEALGMCAAVDVILPQASNRLIGMETAGGAEKHPVLWLLHGASDNHTIWQRRTSIERYVAPLGLAVVMPNVHLSGYTDMAHGGKYFTYIADELPTLMRRFFPLSEKREDNFIAGLSMGGAGCMKIGLARPGNYAAIGCLSAGAMNHVPRDTDTDPAHPANQDPRWAAMFHRMFDGRTLEGSEEDVYGNVARLAKDGGPFPRIYHACGKDDFLLAPAHYTRDVFQAIPGNPFDYTYVEDEGAHTWEYWDAHIQDFLRFIRPKTGESA